MRSKDIRNKPWTEEELQVFTRIAKLQAAGDDSDIDYEDIPRLTDEQLAGMVRFRDIKKVPVSVRLDPKVLEWLKSKGEGHLTRINDILAKRYGGGTEGIAEAITQREVNAHAAPPEPQPAARP